MLTPSRPARFFHAVSRLLSNLEAKNHYERLNLHPSASPRDVKKSFYSLSKIHHPDANPDDPRAASTFSLLSESYAILSDPSRRATYDRDVLRVQHAHPHGSYHSANPAGGRAPSGLSRRKGSFRGPPPSFYRSGGWGANAEKRRQAHEESTGAAAGGGAGGGGFTTHQPPRDRDIPHFDREAHTRTHRNQDARRRWRRAVGDDGMEFEPQTSLAGHFFIVAGILAATFLAPVVYLQFMRLGRTTGRSGNDKR